jgi:hypothetical protein
VKKTVLASEQYLLIIPVRNVPNVVISVGQIERMRSLDVRNVITLAMQILMLLLTSLLDLSQENTVPVTNL